MGTIYSYKIIHHQLINIFKLIIGSLINFLVEKSQLSSKSHIKDKKS